LQPFADATVELRDVVLEEETRLVVEAKDLLRHGDMTGTTGAAGYIALKQVLMVFETDRPASKPTLDAAVRYAKAIARISERSEKGDEAIERIAGATNTVAAAFSTGFDLSSVNDSVRKPVEAIFVAIGRIDGQQKLRSIMADMQVDGPSGKGIVPAFQSALKVIATDVHLALASAIDANAANIFNSAYSRPARWFRQVGGRSCLDFYRNHALNTATVVPLPEASAKFVSDCVPDVSRTTNERALRLHLLEARMDEVVAALAERDKVEARNAAHIDSATALLAAADAWAEEHRRVHAYLERCGGLLIFSRKCGELKVDGLFEAISDLKITIRGDSR
jgi:hypothetical protein